MTTNHKSATSRVGRIAVTAAVGVGALLVTIPGASAFAETSPPSPPLVPHDIPASELAGLSPVELEGIARTQFLFPTYRDLSSLPGFVDGGYASETSMVFRLYWHGPLSAVATQILAAAADRGLKSEVVYTPISAAGATSLTNRLFVALSGAGI